MEFWVTAGTVLLSAAVADVFLTFLHKKDWIYYPGVLVRAVVGLWSAVRPHPPARRP